MMTDRNSPEAPEEDFAAMFAASEAAAGRARRPRFAIGDRVRGKVVSIGQEVTVLELAAGGEGTLETLELRMSRAGENAAKVCAFLRDHPKVEHVGYLGFLKDDRQADIYQRHCTGAGSTFSLFLKGGEPEAFRFLDALKIAKLAVSLGGTETLASHPAGMTHLSVPEARKQALGITDNLVRISIGVEDAAPTLAVGAMAALCVMTAVVVPSSLFTRSIASSTTMPVFTSSAPVGSSHRSTSGRLAMARAMATRCCSPPESWAGK